MLTFDATVIGTDIAVTEGIAAPDVPTLSESSVIVPLTGVADQQYVTISLTNVATTPTGGGSGSVRIGFLLGDVNQSRVVTLSDLLHVNGQLAQAASATYFLTDVNASGVVTLADKLLVNSKLTDALPVP